MKEQVNHPSHYAGDSGVECIEAMGIIYGPEAVSTFCLLNAFKYIWRMGKKQAEGSSSVRDLAKAKWYYAYYLDNQAHILGNTQHTDPSSVSVDHIIQAASNFTSVTNPEDNDNPDIHA